MIVTTEWMEEWFGTFNNDYFEGKLPMPQFALTRARTRLGQMSWKRAPVRSVMGIARRIAGAKGAVKMYDFKIAMTTYYDMTPEQAKNVLLHEMIHYVIAYTGLKDSSPHGVIFQGMAQRLNSGYGWHISTSTSTRGWKVNEAVAKKKAASGPQVHLLLVLKTADGKCFLSRVSPRYARKLEAELSRDAYITEHQWYLSTDNSFGSLPKVRSLRGRRIPTADYDKFENMPDTVVFNF